MDISEALEAYIEEQDWARETVVWARARFKRFVGFLEGEGIDYHRLTVGQFNKFMAGLRREGFSWSLRNGTYTAVSAFYRWLYLNGHIERNIFADRDTRPRRPRKEKRVVKPVARVHIITMLKHLEGETGMEDMRNRAIIHLMASTGVRRMEVVNLKLSDVDFERGVIYIKGKFGNERIGFISTGLREALQRWLQVRPGSEYDHVFLSLHPDKRGEYHPLRPDAINKIVEKVKRDAGIPESVRITPHGFRHFFATEAAKADNPFALMKLLGHSDIKTTEIYVTVPQSELRRVAGKVRL